MEREYRPSAIEQADGVVNNYIYDQVSGAYEKILRLQANEGDVCTCPNCKKEAVSEINSLLDFVCAENDALYEELHYEILNHPGGTTEIIQGCCGSASSSLEEY